jgi:radical SAM superfamily enzyme YgiQ (UPF0313 family)
MRFLLINPNSSISESASPSLGLAFVAGALERAGVEVRILDLAVFPYSRAMLQSILEDFQPAVVGATAVTIAFDAAAAVLREVKSLDPDILTVMGGPHVTFCAEETLRAFPAIDFIVLREGEETVVELARAVESDRRWDRIPGLVYRNGSEIMNTGPRDFLPDVVALPRPARHLLPLGRYRALGLPITMTTSRGCPFNCIFCVGRNMVGQKVRYWSPLQVVDELEQLSALNFLQVIIADDLFTANKKHCHAICDEIIRRGLKTQWSSFARVDTVSEELLAKMKKAGCTGLLFGVESANARILDLINKKITTTQVEQAMKMCVAAGITPCASFILGLPGETPESMIESQNFGEKLKSLGASYGFHFLAPFPGTQVREKSTEYGLKILSNDWKDYHANSAIVETETVTSDMLNQVARKWDRAIEEYYREMRLRRDRAQALPEEEQALRGMDRATIIYELMMQGTIEKVGSWTGGNGSPARALDLLAKRVTEAVGRPPDMVLDAIESAVRQDNLRCHMDSGAVRWAWVDYLPV